MSVLCCLGNAIRNARGKWKKGGTLVKMQTANIRFDLRLCEIISLLHGADFIFGRFSQFENKSGYALILIEERFCSVFHFMKD